MCPKFRNFAPVTSRGERRNDRSSRRVRHPLAFCKPLGEGSDCISMTHLQNLHPKHSHPTDGYLLYMNKVCPHGMCGMVSAVIGYVCPDDQTVWLPSWELL